MTDVLDVSDFCESKFTESRDREWDFSRKFLRVENENESSQGKIESWEWEWEFWKEKMRLKLRMRLPIFKNEGEKCNFYDSSY